jgi:flagellar motor switch protein FliM
MSEHSVLSEEELDALRATGGDARAAPAPRAGRGGECRAYDFRDPARALNGRLPGLEKVHDAFVRGMRKALRVLLARPVEVDAGETALTRLGDYQHSLPLPVSVHAAVVQGREHSMFLVIEGALVYACVDAFFGGRGGAVPAPERELSASERRLTGLFAGCVFEELRGAWAPLCALRFAEPQPTRVSDPGGLREDQIMAVSRFQVDLTPGSGEFHLAMPYALLDGLRPYLSAGPRGEDNAREWRARFAERVHAVELQTRAVFPGVRISFAELMALQAGDFIPISRNNRVNVMVGERVLHIAEPGASNGLAAAKLLAPAPPGR